MGVDKTKILDKVSNLLFELQFLRIEWFLVLTDTEGYHDNRGSELGEKFLEVSSDITDRFTQHCKDMAHGIIEPNVRKNYCQKDVEVNFSNSTDSTEVRSKTDNNQNKADIKGITAGSISGETGGTDAESMTEKFDFNLERDVIACLDDGSGTRCILRSQKRKTYLELLEFENKKSRKLPMFEKKINEMQDETSEWETNNVKEYKSPSSVNTSDANKLEIKITSTYMAEDMTFTPCALAGNGDINSVDCSTQNYSNNLTHSDMSDLIGSSDKSESNCANACETESKTINTDSANIDKIDNKAEHTLESESNSSNRDESTNTDKSGSHSLYKYINSDKTGSNISKTDIIENSAETIDKSEICGTIENHAESTYIDKSEIRGTDTDKTGRSIIELEKYKLESQFASLEHDVKNCDEIFSSKACETLHKAKHDGVKFICHICGKTLPNQSKLTYHHMTHHGEDRIHKCNECEKSFKTKDVLTRHIRTHKPSKHFYCETCGAGFNQTGALQRHRIVHTDVKPHKCDTCGVEYRSVFSLKAHKLRTNHYTDEDKEKIPSIICDVCSKVFLSRYEYERHYRTHSDTKPFTCTICLKSFNDKSNLRQHGKIHDNDRPHECGTCDRRFIQPRSLRKHLLQSGHCDKDGNAIKLPDSVHVIKDAVSEHYDKDPNMIKLPVKVPLIKDAVSENCDKDGNTINLQAKVHVIKDAGTGHFDKGGNAIKLPAKVQVIKDAYSFPVKEEKILYEYQASQGHLNKIHENRTNTCRENKTESHVPLKKPVSILSNFDLLSAAASHVEKLAVEKDRLEKEPDRIGKEPDTMGKQPVRMGEESVIMGKIRPYNLLFEEVKLDNTVETQVSGQDGKAEKEVKWYTHLNIEENELDAGNDTMNSNSSETTVNSKEENAEKLHNGSELRKLLTKENKQDYGTDMMSSNSSETTVSKEENTENQQSVNLQNGSELRRLLTADSATQTGIKKAKLSHMAVKPKSNIMSFKVSQESMPLATTKNTGSKIQYAKTVSSGSKLTSQPSVAMSESGLNLPVNTSIESMEAVESATSVNTLPFTGLKSKEESQNVQSMNNVSQTYQLSELGKLLQSNMTNKSQFHGTILRNIKPVFVSNEPKSEPELPKIMKDLNAESLDSRTDLETAHSEENTNAESDSTKLPDFCFDSDSILNSENGKSGKFDVNSDVNAYLDGNTFVDAHKTNSDSENTLTNTNNDNGNLFMNFLQDDSFSHNLYFNKPVTTERQFDPFFYNNPRSQILCSSTSAETWPGSAPSLNSTLLQDSKYNTTEQVNSESFNSTSEQIFPLP